MTLTGQPVSYAAQRATPTAMPSADAVPGLAQSVCQAERPDLAAAVGELASLGARVFPCVPRGKVPLTPHGCHDATTDATTLRRWWFRWPTANVGLATGGGLLVIDVDPRHGGDASLANLPDLPATRETLTGGGGRHLFYRVAEKVRCSTGHLGHGLDTRGDGGYVVAPPSIHPTGGRYRWRAGFGLGHQVAPAPVWLLEMFQPRRQAAPAQRFDPAPELGQRVERARRYLARVPGAVSGQSGHQATWLAALAMVRGFDLAPDAAFDLLATEFNPRCEPPWSERELRHKVESAARDATADRGYLLRQVRRIG